MRRIVVFGIIAVLLLVTLASAPPVSAASYSLTYGGFSGTCSASGFSTTTTATYNLLTNISVVGTTTLNGVGYDSFSFGLSAGTGSFGTGFTRTFSPALASNTYTFVFRSDLQVGGVSVGVTTTTIVCNAGALSASSSFAEPGAPVVEFAGPGIPAGFVLRTIACDTAVFDAPGGTPVGSNRVTSGQTFFVDPESTEGPDGESWSQVFVSSVVNPWIPTRCVVQ